MFSRFVYVVAYDRIFYFLKGGIFVCIYHFLYSSIDEHLGYFQLWLWWRMLQWTWKCKYLFKILLSVLLDKYLEVRFLGHMIILVLIFWGSFIQFSKVAAPFYIPNTNAQGSDFSAFLPVPVIFCESFWLLWGLEGWFVSFWGSEHSNNGC